MGLVGTVTLIDVQAFNPSTKRIEIVTMPNQDPLTSHVPLLGVDVWEHVLVIFVNPRRTISSTRTSDLIISRQFGT
jgi:hypothetical protein